MEDVTKNRSGLWILATGLVATVLTFLPGRAAGFNDPDTARLVIVHVSCAITTAIWLLVAGYWAFRSLKTEKPREDHRLHAAWDLSTMLAGLTLLTGILFSKLQWNAWWQWDPRQTSFLLVMIILLAGAALRAGQGDAARGRVVSAGYALAAMLPTIFLIFVFPRLNKVASDSNHPTNTLLQGQLDSTFSWCLRLMGLFLMVALVALWRERVRALTLQTELTDTHANMDFDLNSADSGPVVRPVGVRKD